MDFFSAFQGNRSLFQNRNICNNINVISVGDICQSVHGRYCVLLKTQSHFSLRFHARVTFKGNERLVVLAKKVKIESCYSVWGSKWFLHSTIFGGKGSWIAMLSKTGEIPKSHFSWGAGVPNFYVIHTCSG